MPTSDCQTCHSFSLFFHWTKRYIITLTLFLVVYSSQGYYICIGTFQVRIFAPSWWISSSTISISLVRARFSWTRRRLLAAPARCSSASVILVLVGAFASFLAFFMVSILIPLSLHADCVLHGLLIPFLSRSDIARLNGIAASPCAIARQMSLFLHNT